MKIPAIPALQDIIQKYGKILQVPEIRVWVHPLPSGDDFCYTFDSFKEALQFIKRNKEKRKKKFRVEDAPLIAFRGYELNIFRIKPLKPKRA